MNNVLIHPHVAGHPGRIAALEQRTALRAVIINGRPQLVPATDAPPSRSILAPSFSLAGLNRLLADINHLPSNPPGPEAA